MALDLNYFKEKLEEELAVVAGELSDLGHEDIDPTATEKDELADRMEEFEEHQSESGTLLKRRNEIMAALDRIKDGTYGICEEGGEEIDEERLEANPAARTCTMHV